MTRLFDQRLYAAAAARALKQFPIGPASLTFVRIGENITYRAVEVGSGRSYVLRLHRPSYHTLEELESERTWTRELAAAGLSVPGFILSSAGDNYAPVPVPETGETRWAGLSLWIEGEMLAAVVESEADPAKKARHFRRLGALLAQAHTQAAQWRLPQGFSRHSLDADGLMGETPFWGPFWEHAELTDEERAFFRATRVRLREALLAYGKPPDCYSVIHADLHPNNVVVAGEHLAMIDFDDTAFGWHQYDIAVALLPYRADDHFNLYRDALIEGYRHHRTISDSDLALLPMFMLCRQLAEIGWLHQRPELGILPHFAAKKSKAIEAARAFWSHASC